MRLITKIVLIFLGLSFIVFIIGGVVTVQIISNEVKKEERWFLQERLRSTEKYIERRQPTRDIIRDKVIILPQQDSIEVDNIMFSDTIVYHSTLERPELHNKLEVGKKVEGRFYKITLYDIIIEQDDIVDGVIESLVKTYLLLFVVVLLGSWLLSRGLLKPFEDTLSAIKRFDIKENEPFNLPKTDTKEFKRLNEFIHQMSQKVMADYQSLKEFTENASHEIQTPISIAKGKLEILQNGNLDEEQKILVSEASKSLTNLSKLGNTLTLLAKIDNQEFEQKESVDVSNTLEDLLDEYEELIYLKGINLSKKVSEDIEWSIHPVLLEILITNLLNNAIKHNIPEGGFIKVYLKKNQLIIENSGKPLNHKPELLFARFKKGNQSSSSLGLGLAIIQKICKVSGLKINYINKEQLHQITIES
ncbi:HAMP domain-containing sensor histidine kinase [Marivirga salinae]|uniref:histidine kinase n=1 Tax=Marivirga salinarum TaxID=3059078 RepID=A0AA51N9I2_9BACT|nr:HAMP domain-containing sensor histidine kinase [Marivirga sp. BDSF4-3]WMN11048.1 HAMP domain-containing sensor histidine kinase [Marivirga sp. BDSF4-3]